MAKITTNEINLDLLIKLMGMTQSSNDAEALVALRKANEQILKVGGDWETLLRGKVSIVESPFANVPTVTPRKYDVQAPQAPQRPVATPQKTAPPPSGFKTKDQILAEAMRDAIDRMNKMGVFSNGAYDRAFGLNPNAPKPQTPNTKQFKTKSGKTVEIPTVDGLGLGDLKL